MLAASYTPHFAITYPAVISVSPKDLNAVKKGTEGHICVDTEVCIHIMRLLGFLGDTLT